MRGSYIMLKEFAWKAFENIGDIDYYMLFKEIDQKCKVLDERKIAEDEAAISK
jgi:hypothetical protein